MKKIKMEYEVTGVIHATNKTITTRVRASNSGEARKIMWERIPELVIISVYPIGE